jgi:hypothetical protein
LYGASALYFVGKVKVLIEEKYARAANGGKHFARLVVIMLHSFTQRN